MSALLTPELEVWITWIDHFDLDNYVAGLARLEAAGERRDQAAREAVRLTEQTLTDLRRRLGGS